LTGREAYPKEVALTSGRPDSELIAGSRTEPAMFSGIFERHHRELYRYLRRRAGAELERDPVRAPGRCPYGDVAAGGRRGAR
jgi:hypothetical protein